MTIKRGHLDNEQYEPDPYECNDMLLVRCHVYIIQHTTNLQSTAATLWMSKTSNFNLYVTIIYREQIIQTVNESSTLGQYSFLQ